MLSAGTVVPAVYFFCAYIDRKKISAMGEYIFILGKNPELSTAEIVSYLSNRNMEYTIADHTEKFVVVSSDNIPETMPEDLGGILKYGEILLKSDTREGIINGINQIAVGVDFPEKGLFAVSSYGAGDSAEIGIKMKANLKKMGLKAGLLKHNSLAISHTEVIRRGLVGREYLFCRGGGWWFGPTLSAHDPFEFQKRDVKRPEQRIKLSMPPRLARIMTNMAGTPGKLLDPFCGLGTILQEAAIMGYQVHGVDVDQEAISACKENMIWIKERYKITEPVVERGDARSIHWPDGYFDTVVTEPTLGATLKSYPKPRQAEAIIRKLEPLYNDSIKEMLRVLRKGGRLVMTSPMFRVHNNIYRIEVEKIAERFGGKEIDPIEGKMVHDFPLSDYEPRHRTLREVHIFEKIM